MDFFEDVITKGGAAGALQRSEAKTQALACLAISIMRIPPRLLRSRSSYLEAWKPVLWLMTTSVA